MPFSSLLQRVGGRDLRPAMTAAVLGPYAHAFHDVIEQNMLYHVLAKAAGVSRMQLR